MPWEYGARLFVRPFDTEPHFVVVGDTNPIPKVVQLLDEQLSDSLGMIGEVFSVFDFNVDRWFRDHKSAFDSVADLSPAFIYCYLHRHMLLRQSM